MLKYFCTKLPPSVFMESELPPMMIAGPERVAQCT